MNSTNIWWIVIGVVLAMVGTVGILLFGYMLELAQSENPIDRAYVIKIRVLKWSSLAILMVGAIITIVIIVLKITT